jgi:hypothetical protein
MAPETVSLANGSDARRITVWGAPTTGKTTFLAALNVALERQNEPWRVIGTNEAAAEALARFERALVRDRMFPEATQGLELYSWELMSKIQRRFRRRWFFSYVRDESVVIPLELVDAPGGSADPVTSGQARSRLLFDSIEQSKGIAFFFDPVHELEKGDAFEHTNSVIHAVSQRLRDQGRLMPDGRLPHNVAICVTKFDEFPMVQTARRFRMIEYDDRGVPRVPDNEAREFLVRVLRQFPSRDAELTLSKLERAFHPDRVRYYVTSAIGFYVDPHTNKCNKEDFQNHLPPEGGRLSQIRGDVLPVNVAEPILWLAQA